MRLPLQLEEAELAPQLAAVGRLCTCGRMADDNMLATSSFGGCWRHDVCRRMRKSSWQLRGTHDARVARTAEELSDRVRVPAGHSRPRPPWRSQLPPHQQPQQGQGLGQSRAACQLQLPLLCDLVLKMPSVNESPI